MSRNDGFPYEPIDDDAVEIGAMGKRETMKRLAANGVDVEAFLADVRETVEKAYQKKLAAIANDQQGENR